MAKKIDNGETMGNVAESKFDNVTLGILPEGNKRFSLVQVPINTETKAVGPAEILESGLDRFEVEAAFKVRVVKNVLSNTVPEIV